MMLAHSWLSSVVSPRLAISEDQGRALSKAFCDCARHYSPTGEMSPKTRDTLIFLGAVGLVHGPHLGDIARDRRAARAAAQAAQAQADASTANVVPIGPDGAARAAGGAGWPGLFPA